MYKKLRKVLQCVRYRRVLLGTIGKNNRFRPGVTATSAAIIGNNNYFGDRCMIGYATIGNYCSFAPDVKIAQSQHDISYITSYQSICSRNCNYSLNRAPAMIGNDVWIGANAVVMQGVTIGTGAVIGANAVVTHDIPPYSVAVGVPAKIIKKRFSDDEISMIMQSRWWECEMDAACDKVKMISSKIDAMRNKEDKEDVSI